MPKINFNQADFNINTIVSHSKLKSLQTSGTFRVYGLALHPENCLIRVDTKGSVYLENEEEIQKLLTFFRKNNIEINFYQDESCNHNFHIGLRKDLRNNIVLSSSILQTIIYFLEKRLIIDDNISIPGIPNFPKQGEVGI